jgi:hypothetical protein
MKIEKRNRKNGVRQAVPARRVNLLAGDDFKCAIMGSLGFSTNLIMRHTDFTTSQIGYRLRKAEIRRSDYRNGESAVAESMLQNARMIAIPTVKAHLKELMLAKIDRAS